MEEVNDGAESWKRLTRKPPAVTRMYTQQQPWKRLRLSTADAPDAALRGDTGTAWVYD